MEAVFGEVFPDGAEGSWDIVDEPQHGVPEGGEGVGGIAGSDAACVLAQGNIAAVVKAVFDAPVLAREIEEIIGTGALARQAGNGVGDLAAGLAGNLSATLDAAHLGGTGPLQIGNDLARQGEVADLDTAVALVDGLSVFEVRRGRQRRSRRRVRNRTPKRRG